MTSQISLPPVRVAGIDLSVRRDLQEPGGGPPEGYPYKDEPVPDAVKRESLVSAILTTLHTRFDIRSDALVSGDVFIYYRDEADVRRALAPDVLAIFAADVSQYRDRYGLSLSEVGQPPDFVMEIASPSTRRADLGYKRDAYHWMGVGEYWLFDPDGGANYGQPLAWEMLVAGEYQPMPVERGDDGMMWAHSPALGLDICVQGDRLRFYDPVAGEYLRSLPESEAQRVAAEAALNAEQVARADAEAALNAEQAARADAEAALNAEQAARADAEAQLRQLQAELQRLQEGQPAEAE